MANARTARTGQPNSGLIGRVKMWFTRTPVRAGAALILVLFSAYVLFLAVSVIVAFEGRRWDLPAHVYAAAPELYPGVAVPPQDLALTLERTGYERVEEVTRAGQFRLDEDKVTLWTRAFRHWDFPKGLLESGETARHVLTNRQFSHRRHAASGAESRDRVRRDGHRLHPR